MTLATRPPAIRLHGPRSDFARFTWAQRLPRIVDDVLHDTIWTREERKRLAALRAALVSGTLPDALRSPLDAEYWTDWIARHRGQPLRELTFFELEGYFYRALLDAIDYRDERSRDPFAAQKRAAWQGAALPAMARDLSVEAPDRRAQLTAALSQALWANTLDLSQLTRGDAHHGGGILIDDSAHAIDRLTLASAHSIDLVLDNAGQELAADLALTDRLLRLDRERRVRLHAKPHPSFVSDATVSDVRDALRELAQHPDTSVGAWGTRLSQALAAGRLELATDAFWCRPQAFDELPAALGDEFARSALIILKGDLNYRRYIGDRLWPCETSATALRIPHLAPALALRVLKSELIVGVPGATTRELDAAEPDWMYAGRHAVLQLFT